MKNTDAAKMSLTWNKLVSTRTHTVRWLLGACILAHSIGSIASPQQIARRAFSSVVLLVMEDRKGQPVAIGSGFFVQQNVVATNFHVIRGAVSGSARLVGGKERIRIEGVVAVDERFDLALLRMSVDAPILALAKTNTAAVGDTVYAVGNPQGLEGTFSQGNVSGVREIAGIRLLQITAPISPGSSGGPVLNDAAEVVGVAVASIRGGQNLNFAIPAEALSSLISRIGPPRLLSSVSKNSERRGGRASKSDQEGKASPGKAGTAPRVVDAQPPRAGVTSYAFSWIGDRFSTREDYVKFGFSLKNNLRERVVDIRGVVIFYASDDAPLHHQYFRHEWPPLDPGLAIRASDTASGDVRSVSKRAELRVLDYQTYDASGACEYWRRRARGAFSSTADELKTCKWWSTYGHPLSPEDCERCLLKP